MNLTILLCVSLIWIVKWGEALSRQALAAPHVPKSSVGGNKGGPRLFLDCNGFVKIYLLKIFAVDMMDMHATVLYLFISLKNKGIQLFYMFVCFTHLHFYN